jgi:hypothetical protein
MDEPTEVASPSLIFPTAFCCNCGEVNCAAENQDTRVTRFFAIYGTGATFHLSVPVCTRCRRSLRRRPAVFFSRLLVLALMLCAFLALLLLWQSFGAMPAWMVDHRFEMVALPGVLATIGFYWLRRKRPPQTSFYQPVRIKQARVRFADVMNGRGNVDYMKLAFTNPHYLNVFRNANREAIEAKRLAAVKA